MKTTKISLCIALILSSHLGQLAAQDRAAVDARSIIAKTRSGAVRGVTLNAETHLCVFRGIPYAAPPVGALRWRPPQPVAPWDGVRECTEFGAPAPQKANTNGGDPGSEDCLFLNVWTRRVGEPQAKLPVMVWIHGGGLNKGSGHKEMYEGSGFAQRAVVLVTINYRLGALGFLAHPGLSAESDHGVSGNYGFLDQIAALKWVHDNIAAFGGDPDNVTIFGESAGGTSVSVLCASALAKGLFHRAILQSPWMFGYTTKLAEPNFVRLKKPVAGTPSAEELGVTWAAKYTGKSGAAAIRQLRQLPLEELLAKTAYYRTRATIDGWLLPNHPTLVFAAGQQADVPTMIGTTSDEGNYFLAWIKLADRTEFANKLRDFYSDAAEELAKAFPSSNAKELRQASSRFVTDSWFVQPSRQMLQGMDTVKSPAFQYEFARPSRAFPALGAPHAIELRYVFNTLKDRENRPKDQVLADTVTDCWVRFAKTGNPNGGSLSRWPEYRNDTGEYIQFGHEIRIGSNLHGATCDALDQASRGIWARD